MHSVWLGRFDGWDMAIAVGGYKLTREVTQGAFAEGECVSGACLLFSLCQFLVEPCTEVAAPGLGNNIQHIAGSHQCRLSHLPVSRPCRLVGLRFEFW